ncbi:type II toxin-antitoxin system death-on-curing family toxin [Pelomonas sp. HMWF004]|nr:type II toxin-antitoxin system death-on-curing family toxin [Pelomonas sp. HMWF004]
MSRPPRQWRWLNAEVLQAVHLEQLAEHGGAAGTRDEGLFQSAIARPLNLALHGDPDAFDLAAAYAVGLAKNHPFIDGNKRTAYVAMELFLVLNDWLLTADDGSATLTMLAAAAGDTDEPSLAQWLRAHCKPR